MLTVTEAAYRLGCTPAYVRMLCAKRMIKAQKHGRDWMIDPKLKIKAKTHKLGRPRKVGV